MRTVVHLSDLHFGQIDEALLAPLIAVIHGIRPNLVAVSGDLTQRARSSQFEQARAFLETIRAPRIVVPGNHDVPMRNLFARFFRPLAIEGPQIDVSRHSWEPDCTAFVAASPEEFTRTPTGWAPAVGAQIHDGRFR